jgi:hypothetical protein
LFRLRRQSKTTNSSEIQATHNQPLGETIVKLTGQPFPFALLGQVQFRRQYAEAIPRLLKFARPLLYSMFKLCGKRLEPMFAFPQ